MIRPDRTAARAWGEYVADELRARRAALGVDNRLTLPGRAPRHAQHDGGGDAHNVAVTVPTAEVPR